ncbi:hypothetical protein NP493_4003g00003 [Ridgeia piscesae]|uniref:Uncharacterized protein n=1 Tax=Ridgeia piscesae TaxID=27915 RepID=A0AAD9J3A1_RIDPI|nr:hypothetical protein NP493_4003g00003 [Ridgeia piscesae]
MTPWLGPMAREMTPWLVPMARDDPGLVSAQGQGNDTVGIIQVKVNNPRSSIPPSSRDVVAEGTENDQSVTYTDGTEAEDGSKGCFCGDAGTNDGTKRHWKRWQRDFRHDFWAGLPGETLWTRSARHGASNSTASPLDEPRLHTDRTPEHSGQWAASIWQSGNVSAKVIDKKKSSSTPLQSKEVEKDALAEAAEEWLKLTRTYTNMTRNREATLLAKAGRYRDAFQLWGMAAEAGYDKAHYNVALCYEQGKGTKTDLSKQQGQGGLQNDPQQVMGLLQEAAEGGLKQAQTQLGVLYTAEDTRDWTKASRWFERAAKKKGRKYFRFF